jgi:hypothetical protein
LLYETLASVDRNILRPIQVGLKIEKKNASAPPASFMHSHPLLRFVSAAPVPGQHTHAYIAGGVTRVWEATAVVEATRVMAVLAIETSAYEATAA